MNESKIIGNHLLSEECRKKFAVGEFSPRWKLLNSRRLTAGPYASTPEDGFNGMFFLSIFGAKVKAMASDGGGWRHVSVSIDKCSQPPSWAIMCAVKDLFFEPEDCVIQFHPPKSDYVNNHTGCLHLWQPIGVPIPMPPKEFV